MADEVRFTETMSGTLSTSTAAPYEEAARAGWDGGAALFTLVVVTPDVAAMVADPSHRSPVFGCVLAPGLCAGPLAVRDGHFDLFVDAGPNVIEMRYLLPLVAADGRAFVLRGRKDVRRRRWFPTGLIDTTCLFVDVHEGDVNGPIVRRGILRMGPGAVAMQGLSFRGTIGSIVRFMRHYKIGRAHV